MTGKDPVRDFLKKLGCPAHVIESGLDGLLAAWEKTASEVVRGYGLGLDDYLNDVDGREILEAALQAAESAERNARLPRLEAADRMIRGHLKPAGPCLWGDEEALERGWTPERNWWYFRRLRGLK